MGRKAKRERNLLSHDDRIYDESLSRRSKQKHFLFGVRDRWLMLMSLWFEAPRLGQTSGLDAMGAVLTRSGRRKLPPVTRKAATYEGRELWSKGTVQFRTERPGNSLIFLSIFRPFSFRSRFAIKNLTVYLKTWWFPDQKFNYEVFLNYTRNKIFWGS